MIGNYVSYNGKLIKTEEAKISVGNIAWTYGFGVYENIKLRHGVLFFKDKHLDRLLKSASLIGLEHSFTKEQLAGWLDDLKDKNEIENANLKLLLIGGQEPSLYMMMLAPKFLDKKYYKSGVHVITKEYERFLPQAKTLNMLPSYIFFTEAKKKDAHDTLFLDKEKNIVEGSRSNFFVIKNKELFTAPAEQVLDGVTRQTVIECAKNNGYTLTEQSISLDDINSFDGAFLTHTSGKIVPIKSIDDFKFKEICDPLKELIKFYNDYLKKYVQEKKAS